MAGALKLVTVQDGTGAHTKYLWDFSGTGAGPFQDIEVSVDGNGAVVVSGSVPTGAAGTPNAAVVSIQGIAGGTAMPISGSITATNPSVAATGAVVPASATYIGANVGGNLTALVATANGLKTDGSSVTQPVSNATEAAALGSPADAAWDGAAASASVIAATKALWSKLGAAVLAAGSAVIGKVGLQFAGVDLSAANRLPIDSVVAAAATDRSGTITTGGTAQTLMALNATRRGYWVQNLSSADLWISTIGTAAASQPSLKLVAGALYETPVHHTSTATVSIFGATTGQAFVAREF